ncbi:MAG: helix-turn-helix domain-containing protein [Candidatus Levybacteria bacterium]|nr:helix-turn-helix domain-containing protein [Candidatus Levybacteria bacterium]
MINIGAQFQEERKNQNLSIEEVARATKIRAEFLNAIERGDYKKLPSPAYAHGFVRNYAKFLGLPVERSLAIFRREFDEKKNIEVLPRGLTNSSDFSIPRFKIGKSALLIGVVFLALAGFLFFQYRAAVFNPGLDVDSPEENQVLSSLNIEVRGKTDPNGILMVENEQVTINSDGSFKKQITVFPGSTSLTFQVENKFGRTTTLERKINIKLGD